ncbi:unnamed protein product, partial [Discosporangium mesarthrocarpum]
LAATENGERLGSEDANIYHTITLGLHVRDREALRARLADVSDPDSPYYGDYFTNEQLRAFSSPSEEDISAVMSWLESSGGVDVLDTQKVQMNLNQDLLQVRMSRAAAEELFGTTLAWHKHVEDRPDGQNQSFLRAVTPLNIPEDVANVLSFASVTSPIHSGRASSTRLREGQGRSGD